MIPGLLVTEGPKRGLYLQFQEREPFWIGRSLKADFVIEEDPIVSNRHCRLLRNGSSLFLEDSSRNGTRINSQKIHSSSVLLNLTDIIRVGDAHFQVVDVDEEESYFDFDTIAMDVKDNIGETLREGKLLLEDSSAVKEIDIGEISSFGPYQNIEVIGAGAFGVVYKTLDKENNRLVALKIFTGHFGDSNSDFIKRFLREAALLKKLVHHNLVELYDADCFESDGRKFHYIAMEYFPGVDLTAHIKMYGAMPWKVVLKILLQLCDGLDYMHKKGIIHRDIKPQNVLYNDIRKIAKIIDLGLGKCVHDDERSTFFITNTGSGLGTPFYMPLEQWKAAKNVDERADIYSLGATSYFLLSGVAPYETYRDYLEVFDAVANNRLEPLEKVCKNKEIPKELMEIIKKMMSYDMRDRYQTSLQVLQALKGIEEKYSLS